jgi:uncharacterized protein (TIGR03382 family)
LDPSLRGQAQTTVSAFAQPTIAVTSPADGAKVTGSVSITASGAVAAGTTVKEIAILVDGVALAKGTSATLTAAWNTSALAAGSAHTLTATLSDNAGGATTSTAVKVTIGNPIVAKQGCGCGTSDAGPIAPTLAFFLLAAVGARRRRS